jgi:hypothetical protein
LFAKFSIFSFLFQVKRKEILINKARRYNTYAYMNNLHFSQDQLVQVAKLSDADIAVIDECRGEQNKLGLGYQLGFVRLFNQFPAQVTFEPIEDLVAYMSLQLDIAPVLMLMSTDLSGAVGQNSSIPSIQKMKTHRLCSLLDFTSIFNSWNEFFILSTLDSHVNVPCIYCFFRNI